MQEAEKIVVAKPVASRPYSNFRSSAVHLVGSMGTSPTPLSAKTMMATRPKSWILESSTYDSAAQADPSLDNLSESAAYYTSDEVSVTTTKMDSESTILYKPMAQTVSRARAAFLGKQGLLDTSDEQTVVTDVQAPDQVPDQATYPLYDHPAPCLHQYLPPSMEKSQICEPDSTYQNMGQDMRAEQPQYIGDRPCYDGYSWRKYGQKQVKGSEFPRGYYKCSHPNCPVKKKVERSLDGQISEIVYKGEHNHPKPQLPNQLLSGSQGHEKDNGNPLWSSNPPVEGKVSNKTMENHNEAGFTGTPTYPEKVQLSHNSLVTTKNNDSTKNPDRADRQNGVCDVGSRAATVDNDKPVCKRRKNENQFNVAAAVTEGVAEPHTSIQTSIVSDFSGDGFHWRKYGRKVVKGNTYPRSYYKCSNSKCNARKYVERASDDSGTFITTYEGKHNHDMPVRKTNLVASDHDMVALTNNAMHNLNT